VAAALFTPLAARQVAIRIEQFKAAEARPESFAI
jgi:hypothetical protein